MSTICQHFVQNTWKKDLCSNCFKAREEHDPAVLNGFKTRFNLLVNGNGGSRHPPTSIMKQSANKRSKKAGTVKFPKEESEIIGYGGEEWSSDVEEFELSETSPEDDIHLAPDNETERELQRLTKSNTDFNTNNENLLGETSVSETRRVFANLMLGKTPTDSDGKKQTLLIQVTPFGTKADQRKTKKDTTDNHTPVRLTSYTKNQVDSPKDEKSLLDEINETLEKNKTNQFLQKTNEASKVERIKENLENKSSKSEVELNKENLNPSIKAECVFMNSEVVVRKNGLTRHPAIKRDQEKPVVQAKKDREEANVIEATSPVLVRTELHFVSNELLTLKNGDGVRTIEGQSNVENTRFEETAEKIITLPPSIGGGRVSPPLEIPLIDVLENSRELAGEPDGRADPDIPPEPPALPLTPPPILNVDPRPSFLHSPSKRREKPKVPAKPIKILQSTLKQKSDTPSDSISDSIVGENVYESLKLPLNKQDSNGSNDLRISNKRRAPKPPTESAADSGIYQRNSVNSSNDSPVVREKEKRERASSCSPKLRNNGGDSTPNLTLIPEPAPRRSLSLSQDNLLPNIGTGSLCDRSEEKKKHRARFSLKKFLRMGQHNLNRDIEKPPQSKVQPEDTFNNAPQPKPRLVIVHPTELNGSSVEVVIRSDVDGNVIHDERSEIRLLKPPPPPRGDRNNNKPNPLPPKTDELLRQQKMIYNNNKNRQCQVSNNPKENLYANVGEVRAVLTPSKPVRTASMREREALYEAAQKRSLRKIEHNYEHVELRKETTEHMYDLVSGQRSSSPECDSSLGKDSPPPVPLSNKRMNGGRKSEEHSPDSVNKFHSTTSSSLQYCGSETESEIYSPYSFYGSETDAVEDDVEWSTPGANRTCRLRSRKGRSIVHKNLEDNYGAVVVANHEALAQVLEHMHQTGSGIVPVTLRGLKTSPNLRFTDFALVERGGVRVGRRVFHTALWRAGAHHVTLAIVPLEQGSTLQTNPPLSAAFSLLPITEFNDLVPINCLMEEGDQQVQATIAVLPWMQIDTIQSMGDLLRTKTLPEVRHRDACFIMLQLINGLKCLQAQGIEELPLSLTSFVLCREIERESHSRLCLLQVLVEDNIMMGSLCQIASTALKHLISSDSSLSSLLSNLLQAERATSLTQVKSALEFQLWGPADVVLNNGNGGVGEREVALQRWLDLERATALHGLVRLHRVQLTALEHCHLLFLVRTTARNMCDASLLLDSVNEAIIRVQ